MQDFGSKSMAIEDGRPRYLTAEDGYSRLVLDLECTVDEAAEFVDEAINYCRENGERLLLADIFRVRGFAPNVVKRLLIIERWAESAKGQVKMAMVATREMIDREKIGITMAQNRGFEPEIFDNEAEALRWLRD